MSKIEWLDQPDKDGLWLLSRVFSEEAVVVKVVRCFYHAPNAGWSPCENVPQSYKWARWDGPTRENQNIDGGDKQ